MLVSKQVTVAIDFHTRGRNSMEVNVLMNNILQNILVFVKQKILTHTGLEKLKGEQMGTEISFLGELSLLD